MPRPYRNFQSTEDTKRLRIKSPSPKCTCGDCHNCKFREYAQWWYRQNVAKKKSNNEISDEETRPKDERTMGNEIQDLEDLSTNALTRKLLIELPKTYQCRVWRNNRLVARSMKARTHDVLHDTPQPYRTISAGVNGQADISGLISCLPVYNINIPPIGVRLEIEVKVGKDRQSKQQINFERMIKDMGGIYMIAFDESVITALSVYLKDKRNLLPLQARNFVDNFKILKGGK